MITIADAKAILEKVRLDLEPTEKEMKVLATT